MTTTDQPGSVVLGQGYVGRAVASALGTRGPVTVLHPSTHPPLASRGLEGRSMLLEALERSGGSVVVNSCGRLRGTDEQMLDANVAWPTWLCEVLDGTNARLVHVGSASEYGDPGSAAPIAESAPARPSGLYGETKWAGTSSVIDARRAGLDAVVARGFNLVSSDVPDVSPLHQMRSDVLALGPDGGEVELWWPDTIRDFVAVADLAEAVTRLALAPEPPELVNVCSGVGISFAAIVEALALRRGVPVTIASLERPGIGAVVGDPTRLEQCTGFVPVMSADRVAACLLAERVPS